MMNARQHDSSAPDLDVGATAAQAQRLFDLQLAFNLYPATYAHASWLAPLGQATPTGEEARELHASPFWIRALSTQLLRQEQLDQHFDCDFFDPAKRLALLDAATLTRIAGLVSATLRRERLRRTIRQADVFAVQSCMGSQAHAFAVSWEGPLPLQQHTVEGEGWPTRAVWERTSVARLFTALPSHATGVIGRLRLRFPKDWELPRQPLLAEPLRVGLTQLIVGVIAQASPQWSWLFESRSFEPGAGRC
ncbi:MAG: SctK family type III secretion system sorting platform protein [Steroidobacter sp.]